MYDKNIWFSLQVICWVLGEYGTADGKYDAAYITGKLCDIAEAYSGDETEGIIKIILCFGFCQFGNWNFKTLFVLACLYLSNFRNYYCVSVISKGKKCTIMNGHFFLE